MHKPAARNLFPWHCSLSALCQRHLCWCKTKPFCISPEGAFLSTSVYIYLQRLLNCEIYLTIFTCPLCVGTFGRYRRPHISQNTASRGDIHWTKTSLAVSQVYASSICMSTWTVITQEFSFAVLAIIIYTMRLWSRVMFCCKIVCSMHYTNWNVII